MKKRHEPKPSREFPEVTKIEVDEGVRRTATVNMRLTQSEKDAMTAAAKALGVNLTEYLIKCHEVVSRHLH